VTQKLAPRVTKGQHDRRLSISGPAQVMSHLKTFKKSTRDPAEVFRRLKRDAENNVSCFAFFFVSRLHFFSKHDGCKCASIFS
jgi:hypothetical protein